jgi:hypothetical protein
LVILVCPFGTGIALAESSHHPVNLSFLHPISTNKDTDISTNFRLNLLYGHVGTVRGVDINGIVSRNGSDMRGLQLTGAYSQIEGDFGGCSFTGLVNYVGSEGWGFQLAGMVNYNRGSFTGIQYSGLFNFTETEFTGVQLATVFNLNNGGGKYLQYATIANANAGIFRGAQLSFGINYSSELKGLQFGLTNVASRCRGIQAGISNFAGVVDGVQIGIINVAREINGVPVGVVNWARNGEKDWVTYGSNLAAVSTGLRTSVKGFYSMFVVGVGDLQDEENYTLSFSWHYGHAFSVSEKWNIDTDLGFVHLIPESSDDPAENDNLHFAVQARLLGEYRFSEKATIFAGGGISMLFSEYSAEASSDFDPLIVLGFSVF